MSDRDGSAPTEFEAHRAGEAWRPYHSLATAYLYTSLRGLRR